jgi:hypothetical protein
VTGSYRSGSTWVGEMLAASPEVGYIYEPFNIAYRRPGISRAELTHWLEYVPPGTTGPLRNGLADTLAFHYQYAAALRAVHSPVDFLRMIRDAARFEHFRLTRRRPLVKDPLAIFSAEWLHETFDMDIVVVIRHPAAFVASVRRLGWYFSFAQLLEQRLLIRDLLQPCEEEIRTAALSTLDRLEQAALMWKFIHHAIATYQDRHPDWIFVRHEDFSMNPLDRFQEIYARLGLPYTRRVRDSIARSTNDENPRIRAEDDPHTTKLNSRANAFGWRQHLSQEEVLRIRTLVEPYGTHFYGGDDEW